MIEWVMMVKDPLQKKLQWQCVNSRKLLLKRKSQHQTTVGGGAYTKGPKARLCGDEHPTQRKQACTKVQLALRQL